MTVSPASEPRGRAVAGRTSYLVLHNSGELATPDAAGTRVLRYPKGAVVFRDGRVLEVGAGPSCCAGTARHGRSTPTVASSPQAWWTATPT